MPFTAGVINLAAVPPVAQLQHSDTSPHALANPYSGSGSLDPTGAAPAYGIHWSVVGNPAGAGRAARAVTVFEEQVVSLAVQHELADLSTYIGERVLTGDAEGWLLFSSGLPTAVLYDITPGFDVHFDWLVLP
jgi:hypothetical protein